MIARHDKAKHYYWGHFWLFTFLSVCCGKKKMVFLIQMDPNGSFSTCLLSQAITLANKAVEKAVMDKDQQEAWSLLYMHGYHSHSSHHINKTNWFVHLHSSHLSLSTWGAVSLEIKHPSGKKKCIAINEWNNSWMLRKATKVQVYSSVLAFLYKPEMTKWSLTHQLETVS